MKHLIGRTEIKSVHGRKMRSSKTQHVHNYRTNPAIAAPYQKNDSGAHQRKSQRITEKQSQQLQVLQEQRQNSALRAIASA